MGRAPCCDKNGLKKGPWTPEEDQNLTDYIKVHGSGNWRTLPKNAGLQRCGKSCRLRWTNYLRPDIKRGRFSFEEEERIIQLHSILGNKWSTIAVRLPGRTDDEIKNYWNTHVRKKLLRMGIDPVTHTPRLDLLDLSSILSTYLYSNSSEMNVSRLIGIQPLVNPEILKIASSLLSSQRGNPNNFRQNVQENKYHEQLFQNVEAQMVQEVPYLSSRSDQFSDGVQLVVHNVELSSSSDDTNLSSQKAVQANYEWQSNGMPSNLSDQEYVSLGYYGGSDQNIMVSQYVIF